MNTNHAAGAFPWVHSLGERSRGMAQVVTVSHDVLTFYWRLVRKSRMKNAIRWLYAVALLLATSQTASIYQSSLLQREFARLDERGASYRVLPGLPLGGNQLEVIDPVSGQRWVFDVDRVFTPREPTYTGLPTLTIDLRTIDTNLYNWRFRYQTSIPVTGDWGFPLQVGDINGDNTYEAYGVYQSQSEWNTRVYQQEGIEGWTLAYRYSFENSGRAETQADIDQNNLGEIHIRRGDSLFVFEQVAPDSLPKAVKFRHRQWYQSATGIPNQLFDMTGNDTAEIVYRGSRLDSLGQPNIEKTFIMRFDQSTNNLEEVWSAQLPPGCQSQGCAGIMATGDFDGDGRAEFVTSNFAGNTYVVEHVAGDSFAVTWSTNLSVAGRAASGDVDGNSITEFFVGGTQLELDGYVHLRVYAFERTGDNTFQPVFQFDIFPTGIFFVDLYLTTDVVGDNIPELLISTSGGIIIIKGAGEHNYELFYYQASSALDGVAAWKINNNRAAHLFVSRFIGSQQVITRTDLYSLDSSLVVGVPLPENSPRELRLMSAYPNPFNSQTTITYELPERGHLRLAVFDITGKEVISLVNGVQEAGSHFAHWAPSNLASGVYLARLTVNQQSIVRKVVYFK